MCYLESDTPFGHPMVYNTEMGALGSHNQSLDFVRTSWDESVDVNSINPGQQLYEKMVSGMYMGELVRTIVVDLMGQSLLFSNHQCGTFRTANSFMSSYISTVELDSVHEPSLANTEAVLRLMGIERPSRQDCLALHLICTSVSKRSAYLVSASIATILRRIQRPSVTVGVDGSVFRHHPHYRHTMKAKIDELLHQSSSPVNTDAIHFQLLLSEDGSGRGAALVAAVSQPSRLSVTPVEPSLELHHVCHRCRHPDCRQSLTASEKASSFFAADSFQPCYAKVNV